MPFASTANRNRMRAIVRQHRPPCAICGEAIDYDIDFERDETTGEPRRGPGGGKIPHPRSFTVDHIVSPLDGGSDRIENLRAAHRACNRDKGRAEHGTIIRRSKSLSL